MGARAQRLGARRVPRSVLIPWSRARHLICRNRQRPGRARLEAADRPSAVREAHAMDNGGRPTFDLPRYLSTLPLFHDLAPAELARLAEGCTLRRLVRGEAVFRVGEPCEHFHVTVIGQVKLFALSPGGQEKVIELIGPGGTFAEALMFTGRPYIVS